MSEKCEGCPYSVECLSEGPVEFCSMWDSEIDREFNDLMGRLALETDCSWRDALPEKHQRFLTIVDKLGSPPKRENPRVTDDEMECIEELCDETIPCELLCGKLGLQYCPLK